MNIQRTSSRLVTGVASWRGLALLAALVVAMAPPPALASTAGRAAQSRAASAIRLFPVASPVTFSQRNYPDDVSNLVIGPDRNIWFTESNPGDTGIGRITTSGALSSFLLAKPTLSTDSIAAGNDGTLWFTSTYLDQHNELQHVLQRITTAGAILPTPGLADDSPVTIGPDGNMWTPGGFNGTPSIAEITAAGVSQQLPLPSDWYPSAGPIITGPDGALWFTGTAPDGNNMVGRMTLSGAFSGYELPGPPNTVTGITAGPDGAVWFSENDEDTGHIGRITPQGQMTVFKLPLDPQTGEPLLPDSIARGPDGALWFTATYLGDGSGPTGDIGRITTGGHVSLYYPPYDLSPESILTGPDGNLWIGLDGDVGRLSPSATPGQLTEASTTTAPPPPPKHHKPQPKKRHKPRPKKPPKPQRRHPRHRSKHGHK